MAFGIVDADYADNEDNEGELGFLFYNLSNETVVIEKGDKIELKDPYSNKKYMFEVAG